MIFANHPCVPRMPVEAIRLIRKMRGGAQAHLLECGDGHFYVVKFRNNPQHRRILINEWIASVFLNYLQISAPPPRLSTSRPSFSSPIPISTFSSVRAIWLWNLAGILDRATPAIPAKVMVYDFLPDPLLDKVVNASEFLGVLAFDKWMGNADARQSIFFRARLRQWSPSYRDRRPAQVSSRR